MRWRFSSDVPAEWSLPLEPGYQRGACRGCGAPLRQKIDGRCRLYCSVRCRYIHRKGARGMCLRGKRLEWLWVCRWLGWCPSCLQCVPQAHTKPFVFCSGRCARMWGRLC